VTGESLDLLHYLDEHFEGPKLAPTVSNLVITPYLYFFYLVYFMVFVNGRRYFRFTMFLMFKNVDVSRRKARNRQLMRL